MAKKRSELVISVDRDLYPLDAVYGASYSFLEKAYIKLQKGTGTEIDIIFKGKELVDKKEMDELGGEFMNELLNYSLKSQISKSNRKIREYMIGRALASALPEPVATGKKGASGSGPVTKYRFSESERWNKSTLDKKFREGLDPKRMTASEASSCSMKEDSDVGNEFVKDPIWEKDPRGIAIPWEKKYKEKKKSRKKK